ncbi:NUDIX hydrolase [Breoghania sp. L-A4]|uniref:NUDIX hydrolase n=1 Tax=Breoghania sp. L-A4 TaxID=2304600 RepID=UPI000E35F94A|nr:NUDIX hydrolase [Breoghania sp. L-A4]AXS40132.1 NUDIX domain-containing protein [Breoghania sp. L-A4]
MRPQRSSLKHARQYAALPYRLRENGDMEILLVTSRDTGRWVIPKGWPKKRMSPHKLALLEAHEEAGVRGKIGKDPIGIFRYTKRMDKKPDVICHVSVFPLKVLTELNKWPEKHERERRWMTPAEAAERVSEDELAAILTGFKPAA